jgi:hypothetical protein
MVEIVNDQTWEKGLMNKAKVMKRGKYAKVKGY